MKWWLGYWIFCVETLTIATWLCDSELVISLDVHKAMQSYFPFLVLEITENGVQRAECIMEGEVCVQDHKLADTYVDSSPGSFLEERGLSPPPVFRGESSLEH